MSQLLLQKMGRQLIAARVEDVDALPVLEIEAPEWNCLINNVDKWLMLLQGQP